MDHGIDRCKLTEKLELWQWTFNRPEVGILDKMVGKFHPHYSCHNMSSTQKTQRLTSRIHTHAHFCAANRYITEQNKSKQLQNFQVLPFLSADRCNIDSEDSYCTKRHPRHLFSRKMHFIHFLMQTWGVATGSFNEMVNGGFKEIMVEKFTSCQIPNYLFSNFTLK